MTPLARHLESIDLRPHPAEDDLVHTVSQSPGVEEGEIKDARAAGLSWPFILGLLAKFGPLFGQALALILAALKTPAPPAPTPAAEKEQVTRNKSRAEKRLKAEQERDECRAEDDKARAAEAEKARALAQQGQGQRAGKDADQAKGPEQPNDPNRQPAKPSTLNPPPQASSRGSGQEQTGKSPHP